MIIDFHTHVFPSFFRNERNLYFPEESAFEQLYRSPKSKLVGIKELLENMDQEGVHKSVVLITMFFLEEGNAATTEHGHHYPS